MSVSYDPFQAATLQTPAFRSDRVAWAWRITGGAMFLIAALVIIYMLASFLQWRTDFQADSLHSANARIMRDMHNPANLASIRGVEMQAQR
jgi:cytochrome c-type biogenesis protein CcmH/NrfG